MENEGTRLDAQFDASPPPILSVDQSKCIDRNWVDEYLVNYNTVLYYCQDWYTKMSLKSKLGFIRRLIATIVDKKELFSIVNFVGPPTKDLVYAKSQFTRSAYDVALRYHNKTEVDDDSSGSLAESFWETFLTFSGREKLSSIVILAHLGGSALQEHVYSEVRETLEKKRRELVRKLVLEFLYDRRKTESGTHSDATGYADEERSSANDVDTASVTGRRRSCRETMTAKRLKSKRPKSKRGKQQPVSRPPDEPTDYESLLNKAVDAYDDALNVMADLSGRKAPATGTRKEKQRSQTRTSKKQSKTNSQNESHVESDRVQMLPIWTNRKILHFMPSPNRKPLSFVNKYWKNAIKMLEGEEKVRKKIDLFLMKQAGGKSRSTSQKGRRGSKSRKSSRSGRASKRNSRKGNGRQNKEGSNNRSRSRTRSKNGSSRKSCKSSAYDPYDGKSEFEGRVSQKLPTATHFGQYHKVNPYSRHYNELDVSCDKYNPDGAMDVSKRWVAYGGNSDVQIFSVMSGKSCHLDLVNVSNIKISCIRFHPEKSLVFTGGYDGSVKMHDIWEKKMKRDFPKHGGIVLSMAVDCRYIASCASDHQIRVRDIFCGELVACLSDFDLPQRLVFAKCCSLALYIAASSGKLKMYDFRRKGSLPGDSERSFQAHKGEITCLRHYSNILLSCGIDGFVRAWTLDFKHPSEVLALNHCVRVNAALLSYRKIVSACEDGTLRIWDVDTSVCYRLVSGNGRSALDVFSVRTTGSVKLVVCYAAGLKILDFPLRRSPKKKIGRYTYSILRPTRDVKMKVIV